MLAELTPIISATSGADKPRLFRALRKYRAKFEWPGNTHVLRVKPRGLTDLLLQEQGFERLKFS
jgi:hypothetical protein